MLGIALVGDGQGRTEMEKGGTDNSIRRKYMKVKGANEETTENRRRVQAI